MPAANPAFSRQLRSEYEAGATLQQLVEKYGTDRSTISRRIVRAGGTMRSRKAAQKTAVPREEWPAMIKRYKAGETLREIAASYDTSFHNIRHYLKQSGVTMRQGGGAGKSSKKRDVICTCPRQREQGLLSWLAA